MPRLGRVLCGKLACVWFMTGAALSREKILRCRIGEVDVDVHGELC